MWNSSVFFYVSLNKLLKNSGDAGDLRHRDTHVTSLYVDYGEI